MSYAPLPGSEFAGYRIVSEVGRGGTATVWLADHEGLSRRVALKILSPELAEDDAFRSRFSQEARITAGLEHPNVLPVYDAGEWEGLLYIAMRYVDGTDLASLISREGALPLDRALALVAQVAAALGAAHAKGLVHRDVKPANVLVDPGAGLGGSDHAYLADFGLARPSLGVSGLTRAGELYGTIDYMAPEQLSGGVVDARTDVYSFSCLVYESLTGVPPFKRDTIVATAAAHLHEDPLPPSHLRPGLTPELDRAVMQGLSKSKDERPSSATALLDNTGGAPGAVAKKTEPVGPKRTLRNLWIGVGLLIVIVAGAFTLAKSRGNGASVGSPSSTPPSPSGTPTTATGSVLLRDGFSPAVTDRWFVSPHGPVRWTYADGRYRIDIDDPTYRWFFSDTGFDPGEKTLAAVGVQVDVVHISGPGRAGVICRSKGIHSNSFYGAYITKSGRYGFDKVDGAITHLSRGTGVAIDPNHAIQLRLDCVEDPNGGVRLTLWANGGFVDDLLDTNTPILGPGSVGVFLSSRIRPAGAVFDNFVVWNLSG
jgi:serine/threonine-protein kinase